MMTRIGSARAGALLALSIFIVNGISPRILSAVSEARTGFRRQEDIGGTWEAEFSGTVVATSTSQTDTFVLELLQRGRRVSGTLRVRGLDTEFALSGEFDGMTLSYTVHGSLGPACEVAVEAEVAVDALNGRMRGTQTQSTCEGTAVGTINAVRRKDQGTILPGVPEAEARR